jgi:hypothetical protein
MTVYALLCYYDNTAELIGVYDSAAKALNKAQQLEQTNEVGVGCWTIKSEKVQ